MILILQLDLQSIGSSPDLHQRVPSSAILGAILVLLLREQITTFLRVYHLQKGVIFGVVLVKFLVGFQAFKID